MRRWKSTGEGKGRTGEKRKTVKGKELKGNK